MFGRWYCSIFLISCMHNINMHAAHNENSQVLAKLFAILSVPGLCTIIDSYRECFSLYKELSDIPSNWVPIGAKLLDDQQLELVSNEQTILYNLSEQKWIRKPVAPPPLGTIMYPVQPPSERKMVLSPTGKYCVSFGGNQFVIIETHSEVKKTCLLSHWMNHDPSIRKLALTYGEQRKS